MLKIKANGDVELTRGDTAHFDVIITQPDGTAYEFAAGDSLKLTVKKDVNGDVLIQKAVENTEIDLAPEDTKDLEFGAYVYDVELTTASGDVYTVVPCSRFTIGKEVG